MATETPADKQGLRRRMGALRRGLTPERYAELSLRAQNRLLQSDLWRGARAVALYMPVRNEVDTRELMRVAQEQGKELFLPACSKDVEGHMEFYACPDREGLHPGPHGILEPLACQEAMLCACPADKSFLLVLPGLAYDLSGIRLGQGGGYYDRYLARPAFAGALRVGLAFEFQVVPALPKDSHDRPVEALCTDESLRFFDTPKPGCL